MWCVFLSRAAREETVELKRLVKASQPSCEPGSGPALWLSAQQWALWLLCSALGYPCHPSCPDPALISCTLWAVPCSFWSLWKPGGCPWKEPLPSDILLMWSTSQMGCRCCTIPDAIAALESATLLWTLCHGSKVSGHPDQICFCKGCESKTSERLQDRNTI